MPIPSCVLLVKTFFTTHLVDHFSHVHKEFAWWKMKSEKWMPFFITLLLPEISQAFHSLGIKLMDFKGSDSDLLLCV